MPYHQLLDKMPKEIQGMINLNSNNSVGPVRDVVEVPPANEQPAPVDFDLLDLETAGLRRSGRTRKSTWKLADPVNRKLKTALGLLSYVVLRISMVHTYAYSALKATRIHKAISMHARMINHIEVINLNADATYNYMSPLLYFYMQLRMVIMRYTIFMRQCSRRIERISLLLCKRRFKITVAGGIGSQC